MKIPYATEQGIISAEQGILAQEQGISPSKAEITAGRGFRYRQPPSIPAPAMPLPEIGVERWQYDLWHQIIRAATDGHPDQVDLDYHPNLGLPAASRYGGVRQPWLAGSKNSITVAPIASKYDQAISCWRFRFHRSQFTNASRFGRPLRTKIHLGHGPSNCRSPLPHLTVIRRTLPPHALTETPESPSHYRFSRRTKTRSPNIICGLSINL